jgi:Kef-type K+ transport system membrane component KefB
VSSVGLGAVAGMGLGLFGGDATIPLLSTFGIVALFLFAGLEVDFAELRRERGILIQHLAIRVLLLAAVGWAAASVFQLDVRAAALVALALLTPSAGFILDSIASLGVTDQERFWIKSKAIATEIVALAVLFITLQSATVRQLALSTVVLVALVALLPLAFRGFASLVVPYAPKSEFAFLVMIAVAAAFVTRSLGAYYLIGAFVAGLTAQRFRQRLPALTSERMLHAVEVFASFFVPFYFFYAGLQLRPDDFGLPALWVGLAFLATMVPLRVGVVAVHRRLAIGEPLRHGRRIGASLLPTLVFTLVIAEVLRDRFGAPASLFGGLIVYTLANTLIPGLVLKLPTPEFETPRVPPIDLPVAAGDAE